MGLRKKIKKFIYRNKFKDFDLKKEKVKDESSESDNKDEEKDFADVDFENDDQ